MPTVARVAAEAHTPVRTCKGCRKKLPKPGLRRYVIQNGELKTDTQQRLPGRGQYYCSEECLQSSQRRKNRNQSRHK